MASHNDLGKEGEELAIRWLQEKGYTIIDHNWRYSRNEIDIVATKPRGDTVRQNFGQRIFLHFIEVKARNFSRFGHPEISVTKKKFKRLQKAAHEYLFRHPGYPWIQYDILAITLYKHREPEYFLIEDVFL